jgi:hypothetical protein
MGEEGVEVGGSDRRMRRRVRKINSNLISKQMSS